MQSVMIYKVTATSLDDGHRLEYGCYMDKTAADAACARMPEEMKAVVFAREAVRYSDGRIYRLQHKPVEFADDKERILSKLTTEERAILGV